MEVRVSRADPANAMFAHEDCGMRVMEDIASQMGKFSEDLCGHLSMSQCGDEHSDSRRLEQAPHEFP